MGTRRKQFPRLCPPLVHLWAAWLCPRSKTQDYQHGCSSQMIVFYDENRSVTAFSPFYRIIWVYKTISWQISADNP